MEQCSFPKSGEQCSLLESVEHSFFFVWNSAVFYAVWNSVVSYKVWNSSVCYRVWNSAVQSPVIRCRGQYRVEARKPQSGARLQGVRRGMGRMCFMENL